MTQQIKKKDFTIVEQSNGNIVFKNNFYKDILNFSLYFKINVNKYGVANVFIDMENNKSHASFYDVCKKYDYLYISDAIGYQFSNVYLTSALIDSDYDKTKILFTLINRSNMDTFVDNMRVNVIAIKIIYNVTRPLSMLYDTPILNYVDISEEYVYEKMSHFLISTPEANALDIVFKKEHIVQPRGVVTFYLPLLFCYHDRPNILMLRSRFSRLGLVVSTITVDQRTVNVTITNNLNRLVELGDRFLVLSPEPLITANLAEGSTLPVLAIFLINGHVTNVPIYRDDACQRKIKQID
jgi:hypothetical protein